MKQIFDDSEQRYGAEKIHTVLAANGIRTSRRRIAAIMQELGLHSVRTDAKKQHKRKQQLKKGKPAETRISGKPSKSDMGQRYCIFAIVSSMALLLLPQAGNTVSNRFKEQSR